MNINKPIKLYITHIIQYKYIFIIYLNNTILLTKLTNIILKKNIDSRYANKLQAYNITHQNILRINNFNLINLVLVLVLVYL